MDSMLIATLRRQDVVTGSVSAVTAVGSEDFLSLGAGLLRWLFSVLCQLGVDCIILVLAMVVAMIEH